MRFHCINLNALEMEITSPTHTYCMTREANQILYIVSHDQS